MKSRFHSGIYLSIHKPDVDSLKKIAQDKIKNINPNYVFNNDALTIMLYDEDIKSQFPEFVSQMADCYQKNIMKSDNIS